MNAACAARMAGTALCAAALAGAAGARSPSIADIVQVADLSGLAAAPDGRQIAFRVDRASIDRNGIELRWLTVDLASGETVEAAGGGDPIVEDPGLLVAGAPVWSPDSRWFYFRALGADGIQIRRASTDGSAAGVVTREDGDVLSVEAAPDGSGIIFETGPSREAIESAERDEYDSGIRVDDHVELAQNMFRGALVNGRRASQRLTGRWFERGGILWNAPRRLRRLDFATTAVTDAPGADGVGIASRGPAARSAAGAVAEAAWDDGGGSLRVTLADGAHIACARDACRTERIAWLAWRPGRDQILFAIEDQALVQSLHLWDIRSGRVRLVIAGDGLMNGGRRAESPCAVTQDAAVCVAAGPASPPLLEAIDLETGARRILFDPNTLLRLKSWPAAERLTWRSREGRLFTGVLFRPPGSAGRRLPLFINYYRCEGFLRGGVGDEWPLVQMAEGGIVSACVNATRTTGPQDAVAQYGAALGGLEALVDLLAARGLVDRARVGMGGLSFGSEVTMWALMNSRLVAAASVASPQLEASSYWLNGVRGRDHHDVLRQVWGLGAPEETPRRWQLVSPALNVAAIRAPLLLQLPEQEARYAAELYARLTVSPTPAEMYVFPDERHIKFQPRHRLAATRRNLDWFRFWLQGLEDPHPDRAQRDQYLRWQALAARALDPVQPRRERSHSSSAARSSSR